MLRSRARRGHSKEKLRVPNRTPRASKPWFRGPSLGSRPHPKTNSQPSILSRKSCSNSLFLVNYSFWFDHQSSGQQQICIFRRLIFWLGEQPDQRTTDWGHQGTSSTKEQPESVQEALDVERHHTRLLKVGSTDPWAKRSKVGDQRFSQKNRLQWEKFCPKWKR